MNCPECGAPIGAEEKFCGNCGTPLQGTTPDAEFIETSQDHPSDIELPPDQGTAPTEQEAPPTEEKSVWDSTEQETIYSESAQLADEPLPLPAQDAYVPDPAGTQDKSTRPAPLPMDYVPVPEKNNKNKTIIIAIVVLVVLLLCCCAAVIAGLVMFGLVEEGQSVSSLLTNLTVAL